jgi:GNAT superfamily N-acetyltransferase
MPENIQPILIRPVEPGDAAQLRENCYSANTLAKVEERIADNLRAYQEGTGVHLVAEVKGVVVGTGGLVRKAHPLHAHRGELVSLVVHPDYQRRGIARRIVTDLRRYAAEMGLQILEVSCRGGTPAEVVYGRLGFVECGRLPAGILPGGIIEPWSERRVYDEVSFYMSVG